MTMLSSPARPTRAFADKIKMQHKLFAALSEMFGREVPLYDKSLAVNKVTNETIVELLGKLHRGFTLTSEQLDKTSGERHGAIRIGTPEEYRWVAGFFAAFGMEPHNFYDMTTLGGKSQPIIATAFRSPVNPEHRVFTSLLMVDSFDPETRQRVEKSLSERQVFSERAKELIRKNEEQGGLEDAEAEELIREGTSRIFKWTGKARNHKLYKELSDSGLKIAADISCFDAHHLNHLTPNTFSIDLYTSAMKFCLGEMDAAQFEARAMKVLAWLAGIADRDYMKLHFRHLTGENIEQFEQAKVSDPEIRALAQKLVSRLRPLADVMQKLSHSGFKDFTEGPPANTPILLRQDSYKALTEPVTFREADGSSVDSSHTARFGEIEQRFYATTPEGRALYDRCLASADGVREKDPGLIKRDYDAYEQRYADGFAEFPKALPELLEKKLVFGRYSVREKSTAKNGSNRSNGADGKAPDTTDISELVKRGVVRYEGLRYEDFLPFSAAGIFASNLGQYGTKTATKAGYSQQTLEKIMGKRIIDPTVVYRGMESESKLQVYADLGLTDKLSSAEKEKLHADVEAYRALVAA